MFYNVKINEELTKNNYQYNSIELKSGSHKLVVVECENCHKIIHREFRNAYKKHQCPVVCGNEKRCWKCEKWKDISLFNKSPNLSGGVAKMCRECNNSYHVTQKVEQNRRAKLKNLFYTDIKKYIKIRCSSIKNNCKRDNIQFNLTPEYLYELWTKQNGLCYYSNLKMGKDIKQDGFQSWDAPSLDRKNPEKGYTIGNIVWCCFGINAFKQALNENEFNKIIKSIIWWKID